MYFFEVTSRISKIYFTSCPRVNNIIYSGLFFPSVFNGRECLRKNCHGEKFKRESQTSSIGKVVTI